LDSVASPIRKLGCGVPVDGDTFNVSVGQNSYGLDGEEEPHIHLFADRGTVVSITEYDIPLPQARELARALMQACDLAESDPSTPRVLRDVATGRVAKRSRKPGNNA
jgi:hypothetical protein